LINKKSIIFVLVLFMALIPISLMGQNEQTSYLISAGADGEFNTSDDLYIAEGGDVKKGAAPVNLESMALSAGSANQGIPEVPEGMAVIFKGSEYQYLTVEDLLSPLVGNSYLVGGSLYVPASVGDLLIDKWEQHIDWEVAGDIILETDIVIDSYKPVNIVSHNGNIVFNNVSISGDPNPYEVNIVAENGSIEGKNSTIVTRPDPDGAISLEAKNSIDVSGANLTSKGDDGLIILSEGNINASNASIVSTDSYNTAVVTIQSAGFIDLGGATVSSNGSPDSTPALLIKSTADGVSAENANLATLIHSKSLEVNAQGLVELDQATVNSKGDINIITSNDIRCVSADITATGLESDLRFESTGVGSTLYVNDANLAGHTITAINLQVEGTPASGVIQ
jgi:hypothetical protein